MNRREFLRHSAATMFTLQTQDQIEIEENQPQLDGEVAFFRIGAIILMALAAVVGSHPKGKELYQRFEDAILGKLKSTDNDLNSPTRQ